MKSETLSKILGRPVNLHHERIEDIVIELIEKIDKLNRKIESKDVYLDDLISRGQDVVSLARKGKGM